MSELDELLAKVRRAYDASVERLEKLAVKAEETADYARYDEVRYDEFERHSDWLGAILLAAERRDGSCK